MIPVIAIVGRPNVGKSTLFNFLTKSRAAIVADMPGVTRDRQYGEGKIGAKPYIVVDTGGLFGEEDNISNLMTKQAFLAMQEADVILFIVDGRAGIISEDQTIVKKLRQLKKPVFLVVNKVEGLNVDVVKSEFYRLGLQEPLPIAAAHGQGIETLMSVVLENLPAVESTESIKEEGIKIAIIGKPNVGKSTLVNRILGEERVLVFDQPGTTRDSIVVPFQRRGTDYVLIDTAGVRKRSKLKESIEKFSVIKALQAIDAANVVIFVIDARENITDQDLHLLGFVLDAGRALIIAINKWEGLKPDVRQQVRKELDRRLTFVDYAPKYFISALRGMGVGDLFSGINLVYQSAMKKMSTPILTRILQKALEEHQPPLVHGRRVKLRYAHAGGHNPPVIVLHGTQTESLPIAYQRYLMNTFRDRLKLVGTPVRLELKNSENPYKGRKNVLTERQVRKRKRLLKRKK